MIQRLLCRPIHVSWLIAVLCVGIVVGVAVSGGAESGMFSSPSWLLCATVVAIIAFSRRQLWVVGLLLVSGMVFGLWRGTIVRGGETAVTSAIGSSILVEGVVAEDADINNRGQVVLRLRNLVLNEKETGGVIWVTVSKRAEISRSDTVLVEGVLSEGFGNFTASMYSAEVKRVYRSDPGDVALAVRDTFAKGVEHAVNEPQSSLGLGYLVGQRRGLPAELDAALVAAGLTHIVVASGYNLTILVRMARRLFERTSKYLSLFSASAMIAGFVAVTGLSPSMSRAGLVAGLSLLAWYYGRKFHPLVLLPFAMAVTVIIQPSYAWGDLGWQLSFAAFAGVMIGAPLIQAYFFGDKPERSLRRIFIETVAAQVWTLPILLLSFGGFSVVAPIANVLILPLVPLAMLLTFIAGISGLVLPAIAAVIGWPAQGLLAYMTSVATFFGELPWAVQQMNITPYMFVGMYVVIIASTYYMWHRTRCRLEETSLMEG